MSTLTTDHVIQYGSYVFSVYAETLGIEATNVYDAAGRTVTHKIVKLTIKDIVQSDNKTDNQLRTIRRVLETPGGTLKYENAGFGLFTFNQATIDLVWGPKPRVLSWKQMGSGNACEFTWQCEVATLDAGGEQRFAPMEFCYKLSWSVDRSGYTIRSYAGFVRIPQARKDVNSRSLTDHADRLRETINPPRIPGFRRLPGQFTIDESKCRLDFTITDEEMPPNIPPEGVVDVQASHSLDSSLTNLQSWNATLSATYELVKGTSAKVAQDHFVRLVGTRIEESRKHIRVGGQASGATTFIPVKLTLSEPELYGRSKASFSLSYFFTTDPGSLFAASGLWRPVPDSNWQKWSASLEQVLGPRGLAGLQFRAADDAIIDIAADRAIIVPGAQANVVQAPNLPLVEQLAKIMGVADLQPAKSWISYWSNLSVNVLDEVAELKLLPGDRVGQINRMEPSASGTQGYEVPYPGGQIASILQLRARPTIVIVLSGEALRARFRINAPQLTNFGGHTPIEANLPENGFWTGTVANYGVPINGARWQLRYLLPGTPTGEARVPWTVLLNSPGQAIAVGGLGTVA